jgi:hypothetical protein
MRLMKARELVETGCISFEEFYSDIPQYAILSHTWDEKQEVTLQECNHASSKSKSGYKKVRKTCELALGDDLEYVWVDTCCIDKTSSAELTEAINSMFLWYQKASACYVHLADKITGSPLVNCRWFTRGWTLQELIAPGSMTFFSRNWVPIGTKKGLLKQLATITRIDMDILSHNVPVSSACMAKRLSWAANRKTTRVEDMAYCLLGICDINMPMLYGEGQAAFRRLQEEIIKSTNDLSLLAWTSANPSEEEYCGFLAESVRHFASCSEMYSIKDSLLDEGEMSISNKGLRLKAKVCVISYSSHRHRYGLKLDCIVPGLNEGFLIIPMRKVGPGTFIRTRSLDEMNAESGATRSVPFRLECMSSFENPFCLVTLLATLPNLNLQSPMSRARGSNIVSFSRLTLVQIELPADLSIVIGTETPTKIWDMEDHAFFGPHDSYQNWGALVLEINALFICFWYKKGADWTVEGTLLDLRSQEAYIFWKDLFVSAEQLDSQQPIVQYILDNVQGEMKSSIETQFGEQKIRISFKVWRAESGNLCSGPRWRVAFQRDVLD